MLVTRPNLRMNRTQIDVPAPLAHIVGVADSIPKLRPLAANITNSCHNSRILPGSLPKYLFYRNEAIFANPGLEAKVRFQSLAQGLTSTI
jgi:hypothetical protein